IPAFAQLEAVRRVMAEIVIRQARVLVGFADIHRHPLAVGKELGPAVVTVDAALVSFGGDGGADGEARWNARLAREGAERGVEDREVAVRRVARLARIASTHAGAILAIAYLLDHMIIKRPRPGQIGSFPARDLLRDDAEGFVGRDEPFRTEIAFGIL